MNVEEYFPKTRVIATHKTFSNWVRKTDKKITDYVLVTKGYELRGLIRDDTRVIFIGDYWHAADIDDMYRVCKERNFKITHIDNF